MPSEGVEVSKRRQNHPEFIYIALGTNLGDRSANLKAAISALASKVEVLRASPVYETDPWGYLDQPAFLNQAVEVHTMLTPWSLLKHLKRIEQRMGRTPTFRNGPRLIDLDILFYGERVIESPPLQIPHPRLAERAFVLAPLAQLAPGLRHPLLKVTIQQMLDCVDITSVRRYSDSE
jgi:2-amino-4-hydroxy-6-hydroxymethyldihydropteridine diphosphokinase